MSGGNEKFTPDIKAKASPLGKIIASIIFVLLGSLLAFFVFAQYQKLLVPGIIVLATGIILLSIWLESLYIYRYMLPAIIIILVFTVYPIGYTIFIAFTNYGTGHLFVKDDAKNELLRNKWDVDETENPIYAEFYVDKNVIDDFHKKWKSEKVKYIEDAKKIKKLFIEKSKAENPDFDETALTDDDIPELVVLKDKWFDETENKIITETLGKVAKEDVCAIVFNANEIAVNEDGIPESFAKKAAYEKASEERKNLEREYAEKKIKKQLPPLELTDVSTDEKVYTAQYDAKQKQFVMNEITFDKVSSFTDGMILVSDPVRKTISQSEIDDNQMSIYDNIDDEFYAEDYVVGFSDFTDLETSLRENTPLALLDNTTGDYKRFLNSIGNEFMKKERTFKVIDGQIYKLTVQDDGRLKYTQKVYEDSVGGKFVITNDGEAPAYWKEYFLTKPEFKYGIFTLSNNSSVESFLREKMDAEGFDYKTAIESFSEVEGKKLADVDADKLRAVKKEISEANKVIFAFNRKLKEYKKEYIESNAKKLEESNVQSRQKIADCLEEMKALKAENKESKKLPLNYKVYKDIKNNKVRIDTLIKEIRLAKKEIKGRAVQLKSVEMPKVAKIKVITDMVSNIDYAESIEPGYVTTVGMSNFTKIATTRNITSPFLRVFLWTILWSFFSVLSSFAVGLALALVFNAGDLKGKFFYRTLFILPYAIPSFVSVLMWSGFLNDDFGVINLALGLDVPWLMDPTGLLPKISCIIVNLWLSFPYMMIISLGALQSIDTTMYEAADVDGASRSQQFWRITLPLLLTTLGPMLVGSFAFAFNNFAGIYLLTMGRPVMDSGVLPGHTDILISYTYKLAFGENATDYGLASAIGIIVFIIIGSITFFQFKFTGTFKEVDNA